MIKAYTCIAFSLFMVTITNQNAGAAPMIIGERAGTFNTTSFRSRTVDLITFDNTRTGGCVNGSTIGIPNQFITTINTPNVSLNPTNSCYLSLGANDTARLSFRSARQELGFFWGSIDVFNSVRFFLNGVNIFELGGADAVRNIRLTEGFINFLFGPGTGFDTIEFISTSRAFEIDNITIGLTVINPPTTFPVADGPVVYPFDPGIPFPPRPVGLGFTPINVSFDEGDSLNVATQAVSEPASLALFGAGLLGLGLAVGRRKQRQSQKI